ncbi:MAG: SLC26A/SulP transporter family protein, partial [Gemmatimonadaceae bacterium]|nr:SLC26A/SulP transporter family protein [Acetobacteraceae bacterium]
MIVRYVPLQVMAGLIATVGLSLVMGGLGVATSSASGELFAALQDPAAVLHVATAVAVALALVALQQRIRSAWLMPALVAVASGLHHGVFALLGQSLAQQRADNWLLQPPGVLQPWLPWSAPSLAAVDWAVLLPMLPASAALCAIVSITVMLNASGLELVLRRDVDVDRDLRAHGLANIAASLAGGILGCVSISRSAVLARSGPGMRWVTASAGLVAGLAPLAYPDLLGLIPRSVLAAVLLHVGWGILKAWVIDIRRRLTWLEWLTVPAVLAVNAQFGLVAGVLAGLTLGCITFAVLYSAGSPVRARYRGDVARSNVARSDAERAVLLAHADATLVLYLQGFLFFGTANQLLAEVRAALREGGGRLTAIVLDLSSIDGLDGSARNVLERLQQVAHEAGCALHAAAPSQAARLLLGSLPQDPSPIRIAPTLDAALEGCEQAILAPHAADLAAPEQSLAEELGPAADALLAAMERVDLEAGAVLMTQGERSSDLLFIEKGRASVTMRLGDGPAVRVRSFGPATMVGEVGFLLGLPRTATVTADTACRLLRLSRPALARLEAEQPAAA